MPKTAKPIKRNQSVEKYLNKARKEFTKNLKLVEHAIDKVAYLDKAAKKALKAELHAMRKVADLNYREMISHIPPELLSKRLNELTLEEQKTLMLIKREFNQRFMEETNFLMEFANIPEVMSQIMAVCASEHNDFHYAVNDATNLKSAQHRGSTGHHYYYSHGGMDFYEWYFWTHEGPYMIEGMARLTAFTVRLTANTVSSIASRTPLPNLLNASGNLFVQAASAVARGGQAVVNVGVDGLRLLGRGALEGLRFAGKGLATIGKPIAQVASSMGKGIAGAGEDAVKAIGAAILAVAAACYYAARAVYNGIKSLGGKFSTPVISGKAIIATVAVPLGKFAFAALGLRTLANMARQTKIIFSKSSGEHTFSARKRQNAKRRILRTVAAAVIGAAAGYALLPAAIIGAAVGLMLSAWFADEGHKPLKRIWRKKVAKKPSKKYRLTETELASLDRKGISRAQALDTMKFLQRKIANNKAKAKQAYSEANKENHAWPVRFVKWCARQLGLSKGYDKHNYLNTRDAAGAHAGRVSKKSLVHADDRLNAYAHAHLYYSNLLEQLHGGDVGVFQTLNEKYSAKAGDAEELPPPQSYDDVMCLPSAPPFDDDVTPKEDEHAATRPAEATNKKYKPDYELLQARHGFFAGTDRSPETNAGYYQRTRAVAGAAVKKL